MCNMKKYIMVILNWKQGALCDIVLPFCVRTIDKKKTNSYYNDGSVNQRVQLAWAMRKY